MLPLLLGASTGNLSQSFFDPISLGSWYPYLNSHLGSWHCKKRLQICFLFQMEKAWKGKEKWRRREKSNLLLKASWQYSLRVAVCLLAFLASFVHWFRCFHFLNVANRRLRSALNSTKHVHCGGPATLSSVSSIVKKRCSSLGPVFDLHRGETPPSDANLVSECTLTAQRTCTHKTTCIFHALQSSLV